jgi:hypothetical protein
MAYPDRDYRSTTTGSSWGAYAIAIILALVVLFGIMSAFRTTDTTVINSPASPPATTQTPESSPQPPAPAPAP